MIKKLILWILVLSCAGTIFFFSSQKSEKSGNTSRSFTSYIVKRLDFNGSLSDEEVLEIAKKLDHFIRNLAHFSIYAILGFFTALLCREYNLKKSKIVITASLAAALYAVSDEVHQHFVEGRSFQLSDIGLDSAGGFFGAIAVIILICITENIKRRKQQ